MKKIKLYAVSTTETKDLENRFVESIKDDIDVAIIDFGYSGSEGTFGTKGYLDVLKKRANFWADTVEKNLGDIIIFCDIDIIFYSEFTGIINELMKEKDLLFQSERWPGKNVNCGFAVIRCNIATLNFYKHVSKSEFGNLPYYDQSVINNLLETDQFDIKWDVLPKEFWAMSHYAPPVKGIILHHANCTGPITRNGIEYTSLNLKLEQYSIVKNYLAAVKDLEL